MISRGNDQKNYIYKSIEVVLFLLGLCIFYSKIEIRINTKKFPRF